jgi:hypothetical protein
MNIYFPLTAARTYLREGMVLPVSDKLSVPRCPTNPDEILTPEYIGECKRIAEESVGWQGPHILTYIDTMPRTVLDIGCGLGIFSLSLYHALDEKPTLYMVDGDNGGTYMTKFTNDGHDLVTDTSVTKDFVLGNGVHADHMVLVPPLMEEVAKLPRMDLVVSNYSWFYHYPPEVYWDAVRAIMHETSFMKVNIRLDGGHPEYLDWMKARFHEVTVTELLQNDWNKSITVLAHKPI